MGLRTLLSALRGDQGVTCSRAGEAWRPADVPPIEYKAQVASAPAFEYAAQARHLRARRGGSGVRDQLVADGEAEQDFLRIQEYSRAWLIHAQQVAAAPGERSPLAILSLVAQLGGLVEAQIGKRLLLAVASPGRRSPSGGPSLARK